MNKPARPPRCRVDGVLLLDKPVGISSNAALQRARHLYNAAKAGHTGTLDPLASGLLPLCFGEATKFASTLIDADKSYIASVRLGITTDSGDAEGQVLAEHPVTVSEGDLHDLLPQFRGSIEQMPPMHSALKHAGKPLYHYARQGIEIERKPRQVIIHRLELQDWQADRFVLRVDCSKGTYIRSLAADIGVALGCGAHLTALRRCRVGDLQLDDALSLEQIEAQGSEARAQLLSPVDSLLQPLPAVQLSDEEARRILHGQEICVQQSVAAGQIRLYAPQGFIGVGEMLPAGRLRPLRLVAGAT